ncbi:GntR family transcriptional regulator [Streptomyces sp. NPDC059071]|uniref:GntR family transcriptional regulator n=1 Tax=unclassified Streptomyces TaxID=2593676 RepID=UPI003655970E
MPGLDLALGGLAPQRPASARRLVSGPDEPLLLALREELRAGIWPVGQLRTQASLRGRFGTTQLITRAVVRILRNEGLVELDGFGVRAAMPGAPVSARAVTLTDLIEQTVRKRLADHTYPPGWLLPPQREIAAEFATSLTTVRLPLTQLVLEGHLRPHLPHETPGTYAVDHEQEAREALLLADLQAAMYRGRWTRGEYPHAVERAMHQLVGSVRHPALCGARAAATS